MVKIIFFSSLFLIFYAYIGYALTLYIIHFFKSKTVKSKKHHPNVTYIITAFNEEDSIRSKIENTLSIFYPKDKLQIVIASDGSTDKTNEIVEEYRDRGIELLPIPVRKGKENAQKEAIKRASGDIIVFSDVATILEPIGVEQIVSNFADPGIGCVSSVDRIIGKDGKASGEGFYVRYEMWLRNLESKVNSLVGMSGSFFAARRTVCQDFSENLDSDFRTVLNSVKTGLRGVCDPMAIGYYRDISDPGKEFERKVRTVLRGLTVFFKSTEFLNILKYGMFSYQLFCHKFLRWLVPFFLIIEFISNTLLVPASFFYLSILSIQMLLLCIYMFEKINIISVGSGYLRLPIYFINVNASILLAWCKYLMRERVIIWDPTKR